MTPLNRPWVEQTLDNQAVLLDHARNVALIVFKLRWPKAGREYIIVNLNDVLEDRQVSCSYFWHGEDECFNYPLEYLWTSEAQIEEAEIERAKQEVERKEREKAQEAQNQLARRHEQYLRLKQEFEAVPCEAKIWHGPGHQSSTTCRLRGPHDIHEAIYGEFNQVGYWTTNEVYTGVFDEPPVAQED